MRIGILGPLQISGAGVSGTRLRALLVRLALDPGRVVTAERLVDDLWQDGAPEHPTSALQSLVSRARREAPGLIVTHPSGYLLDVRADDVDAWRFERLAREGAAEEALSLWRGTALADAAGMPFAVATAAHLEELRLATLARRIAGDLARGADVTAELEGLVAAHPLREPYHALLVRALLADGRRAEALEVFERVRRRLADELGMDPGRELLDAYEAALRDSPGSSLPAQLTTFVGREADVARVRELLGVARLVTLTGPGGAGKTRLAIETAATLRVPDGVWLVPLAPVSDVLTALSSAVKAADPVAALRGTSPVIVLDNCEHVIDQAADVASRLLTEVPGLRIIATSREPLDVTGEHLHTVPPLDAAAAVHLFSDRAAAARAGLDLSAAADICRELDGIPLAIELAAARLRTLSPSLLAAQLGDRLSLRGSRTAEPRHRTLRAVIDWSWELLSPDERRLLARMSVFSGGATYEAVLEVCGPGVESLVDKSLVTVQGERYTMLETVRRYAAEKLDDPSVVAAHARYYTALAERADSFLRTDAQLDWLAVLDAEQANLDAALDRSGDPLRLFLARIWLWIMRGRRREAQAWAARMPEAEGLAHELCAAITGGVPGPALLESDHPATLAWWGLTGAPAAPDGVMAEARRSLARLGDHPDPWTRATVRLMAGLVEFEYGTPGAADSPLEAALEGFERTGDRWGKAMTLTWLSLAAENRGETARALSFATESVRHATAIGGMEAIPGPVMLRVRLAQLHARLGRFDEAEASLDQTWEAAESDPVARARVLHVRGEIARRKGDQKTAVDLLREALTLVEGAPRQLVALIHMELATASGSRAHVDAALELTADGDDKTVRATVLEGAAAWLPGSEAAALRAEATRLRGLDPEP
ncbi:BTAD domain-containing putative transcriptional regulator [Nonomuraea mangrovi]|uniref:BTAD domain-containing putative transcriptional regulator n=1 Tax=Nonomuraea mangrovi TaxID=2316207 RepID=A0ABW4TBV7_9ACTN